MTPRPDSLPFAPVLPPLLEVDLAHVLDGTASAFQDAPAARILLTGGTGFFGRWLVETYLHAAAKLGLRGALTVLTRDAEAFLASAPHLRGAPSLSFVTGDVRSFEARGLRFTHVVHAATAASQILNDAQPEEMVDVIVGGGRHVLAKALETGADRLLVVSSGAVYGPQPPTLRHVPETYLGGPDPLDPTSAYGEAKRLAEHEAVLAAERHGLSVSMARGFAFVGPHLPLDAHFAIGNFVRDGLHRDTIVVGGDGTPVRSYLYGADLAVWLWTLLFRGAENVAYNVGSEDDRPLSEVAALVGRLAGKPVVIRGTPKPGALPSRYVPSTARAREAFGLAAAIGLEVAVERTLAYNAPPQDGRKR